MWTSWRPPGPAPRSRRRPGPPPRSSPRRRPRTHPPPADDVGCGHADFRRVPGAGSPWLGPADPAGGRADRRRLDDLEIAQEVGLGRRGRCAGAGHARRHEHAAAVGPDRRDRGAAGPVVATPGAALVDLQRRWDLLAERAADDRRRGRSTQIRGLLQALVSAVDAENQALATGRDWRLLRPRVDQVGQALSTVLAGGPQGQPPPGGDPGWPAPGG